VKEKAYESVNFNLPRMAELNQGKSHKQRWILIFNN